MTTLKQQRFDGVIKYAHYHPSGYTDECPGIHQFDRLSSIKQMWEYVKENSLN